MKKKKKATRKGAKKANCEHPEVGLPFSALFRAVFGSLSLFHTVWLLILLHKGCILPEMFKNDWGENYRILSLISLFRECGATFQD
jgi:hypothetical protein